MRLGFDAGPGRSRDWGEGRSERWSGGDRLAVEEQLAALREYWLRKDDPLKGVLACPFVGNTGPLPRAKTNAPFESSSTRTNVSDW